MDSKGSMGKVSPSLRLPASLTGGINKLGSGPGYRTQIVSCRAVYLFHLTDYEARPGKQSKAKQRPGRSMFRDRPLQFESG